MPANTFGEIFRLTTYGESHGKSIGCIIDGCPAGIKLDIDFIQHQLDRRKPGQSDLSSQRKESDIVEIQSGIMDGITTGAPVAMIIKNKDHKPEDYEHLKNVYRPSHADYVYEQKYGIRDHRGGGRASARETACRVAAGALAMLLLKETTTVNITAYVSQIGKIAIKNIYADYRTEEIEKSLVRCPDQEITLKMIKEIEFHRDNKDSIGGIISCIVDNCPPGLGEPVFDRLEANLAKAMLSINATKGFEIGSGFKAAEMSGSQHNDAITVNDGIVTTSTNFSGGVQGGISNGAAICFSVAFKPVATIGKVQNTINNTGEIIKLQAKGRHDPCVVPRAVPIVEAMTALVLADHFLWNKLAKL